jgi:nucleoside-triphosphatase THEP1
MSPTKFYFPSIYNPANQSTEEILSNFVVRLSEFSQLYDAIKIDKMKNPPQHFMIQGQRGYGKTTLLLRLNAEIKQNAELNFWLIPVMFDEEQYSVRTLTKLWEEVIDILENEYECFEGLSEQIESLYDLELPEEEIFNLLLNALKAQNKKIVLLLDNFGDMTGKFSKKENQRLREVLITCSQLRLVGASSTILEFYYDYKQPFFDFFKVITLDELTREETILLLKKLGKTYQYEEIEKIIKDQPGRIEALRRLTGGVPRTIVLLFEIFADNVDGSSFNDLETILDKVTPLYKHRLDNLSAQQQAIIDAIAQNWDAISTGEVAKKVRMESKAVSSQLNQLEKSQLIVKISTSTKNNLYQIQERFFNIYYLMRLGKRKNKNRVLWLVKFF